MQRKHLKLVQREIQRVAIIGAGLSGLAAARTLAAAGVQAVVYEKNDKVGGRIDSLRLGDFIFDTGATNLAPRGRELEKVMLEELDTSDLIAIETPILMHASLRVSHGGSRDKVARYTYRPGNDQLPKMLAEGLDVRLGQPVEDLERLKDGVRVEGEEYDALILTPPIPVAIELLTKLGESRALSNTYYRACISVSLGYAMPPATTAYHALLDPEQRHHITWLSLESVKCPGRAPDGQTAMVVQLSPDFSLRNLEAEDQRVLEATLYYVARLYGQEWAEPVVAHVTRWRHSQPEMAAMFDSANRGASRIIVSGDGVLGARAEYAYEAGVRAAQRLLEQAAAKA
jgi:renalase